MIQRIQTVYLLVGAGCVGSVYLFENLWTGPAAAESAWFVPVTTVLFGLSVVGALAVIFLFGDRQRQRSLVLVLQYVTIAGIISFIGGQYIADALPTQISAQSGPGGWLFLFPPILGYVLFSMARRRINRDIELIRSMDRLR